ncbi:SDR family NAD(P)-dependent oxidoreductase [Saccharothrix sp. 6-C]|uniref:SDR family NAD(P)-dependent oxidoreductase n=1 Tax=Saccharothrix sp. 6-C TaxID=2781735 RepID=UPI001917A103|nr:SDR family NAD(P)-dependent oxidoreductase [Saccharothrix sp. 6-C]QQQ79184.1 SDR family NAD(P)-dependent oxidoreductase [Saccharothrix sp. 6-C]
MDITGKAVLVTGANRGIGKALVEEALRRGVARVYAGTRRPLSHPDGRVVPVTLDVTDAAHIRAAVERVDTLDVLVNNAGVLEFDDLADRELLDRMLAVNFYGVRDVTMAFLPKLVEGGGAVASNISVNGFVALPLSASYSISKAAVLAMSQSLRAILASRGVSVHSILTGPVDTDMTAGLEIAEKASPELVARNILDGIEEGAEDIFPDPLSQGLADDWRAGLHKALERQFASVYEAATRG